MSVDQLILALEDARSRGIKDVTVIINSSIGSHCQLSVLEASVSSITGCVLYVDGHKKGFVGYLKNLNK